MLSSSGSGGISAHTISKAYYPTTGHGRPQATPVNPQFDSSSFSPISDDKSRFHMEVVSRLSREVRTATTTGRIQELKQAVENGTYVPDPVEIAKRAMFFVEG